MTGVLDGVCIGDKVVVERIRMEPVTFKPIKVRSVKTVTRVFKRVIHVGDLTGVDIGTGRGGWEFRETVRVSPLLPGQEAEIETENAARKIAQAEAAEALRLVQESAHRNRVLRNKIRDHLALSVTEDVLQRALDVLTGKDGA